MAATATIIQDTGRLDTQGGCLPQAGDLANRIMPSLREQLDIDDIAYGRAGNEYRHAVMVADAASAIGLSCNSKRRV
jgi:hypothetical protein